MRGNRLLFGELQRSARRQTGKRTRCRTTKTIVDIRVKTVLIKGREVAFDVTSEVTKVHVDSFATTTTNFKTTASESSSLSKRMGVRGPNRSRRRLFSRLDDRRRLENRGRLVNRDGQRLSRRRGHSSLRRAGLLFPRRGRRNRRNNGRGRLRRTGNRIRNSRGSLRISNNHGRGKLRRTGNSRWRRQFVVPKVNGGLVGRSRTFSGLRGQDRSGNQTEDFLITRARLGGRGRDIIRVILIGHGGIDAGGRIVSNRLISNGVAGNRSRTAGGALTRHVARLVTATAQTIQRAVTDTVTELSTHRAGLGLILIPQTGVEASDTYGRRQIFRESDLSHTGTILHIRPARVELGGQGVKDAKLTEKSLDGLIRNLHRQVTKVDKTGTRIHRGNPETSATKRNTTSESCITLGGLLKGDPNNAVRDELDTLDISNVQ